MNYIKEANELYRLPLEDLIEESGRVCNNFHGNAVYLRGLVEFSNFCMMDCQYCGIRKNNTDVARYRMDEEEILSVVRYGWEKGLKTFVLQGGEDPFYNTGRLSRLAEKIKEITGSGAALTYSCGIRTKEEFRDLKNAGCDRYLMRFETADENLYSKIRPGQKLTDRISALSDLKDLGFEAGSGFMVGLPGETDETRVKNIALCAELELNMVGIGPFIPHPMTPLAKSPQEPIDLTIRSVAILRILLPKANIPATTAAGSLDPQGREKMLSAGANVLMPNITPLAHKKDYLLYPGKICLDESGFECIGCLQLRTASIGKKIDWSRGDSLVGRN